jgi:hypothetical protein
MKIGKKMSRISVLKIDKDIHVDRSCVRDYIDAIRVICQTKKVRVTSVEMSHTKKGQHFYIGIQPPISAHSANRLQYLLGDDPRRVDYNRARIRSGYSDWNKLFEDLGRRFWILYRIKVPAGTRKTGKEVNHK